MSQIILYNSSIIQQLFTSILTAPYIFLHLLTFSYSFLHILTTLYSFLQLLIASYDSLHVLTTYSYILSRNRTGPKNATSRITLGNSHAASILPFDSSHHTYFNSATVICRSLISYRENKKKTYYVWISLNFNYILNKLDRDLSIIFRPRLWELIASKNVASSIYLLVFLTKRFLELWSTTFQVSLIHQFYNTIWTRILHGTFQSFKIFLQIAILVEFQIM